MCCLLRWAVSDRVKSCNSVLVPVKIIISVCMALQVAQAMSKDFVRVNAMATVKESLGAMLVDGQRCALVVDENGLLEGILSSSDLQREVLRAVEESVFSDAPAIVEVCLLLLLEYSRYHFFLIESILNGNLNV